MMKKRKNMHFFAAAALTATLITGQFTYVPVMAGSTAEVEVSSLIPDNVTVDSRFLFLKFLFRRVIMVHCHGWTVRAFHLSEYSLMMWFFTRTIQQILRSFPDGMVSRMRFTAA